MTKPIIIGPLILVAALSLAIALVERTKELALHDRLSFDSSPTILANEAAAITASGQ